MIELILSESLYLRLSNEKILEFAENRISIVNYYSFPVPFIEKKEAISSFKGIYKKIGSNRYLLFMERYPPLIVCSAFIYYYTV